MFVSRHGGAIRILSLEPLAIGLNRHEDRELSLRFSLSWRHKALDEEISILTRRSSAGRLSWPRESRHGDNANKDMTNETTHDSIRLRSVVVLTAWSLTSCCLRVRRPWRCRPRMSSRRQYTWSRLRAPLTRQHESARSTRPRVTLSWARTHCQRNLMRLQAARNEERDVATSCRSSSLRLRRQREEFIKTTYDISLDSQISLFPDGFSLR